ncbi:MAG TPA: phosphonoacetaldehyde hydrolase [Candidatus Acidoferrales bacterium]|nr:phosphonoacetaldehyde hydrolase [Candidatus Acidoferrales bacterium]
MKLLNQDLPPEVPRAEKLKALILDWAGTTVDFGSVAPVKTLDKVFTETGIQLTESEIRRGMGLPKKDHIRGLLLLTRVSDAWKELHGRAPSASDVEEIYQRFIPLQLSCLAEYSSLIPGVVDSVRRFRERGLKIGSDTGYTRAMLDLLVEQSAKAGYRPDCSIAPEDVGVGRPEPFMIYENAVRLQVYPLASIAKVGDTPADIQEGLNAGTWSIGIVGTGNGIGLSYEEFQALSPGDRRSRLQNARSELERAGAHYVVDTLAELNAVLDDIDARLKSGGRSTRAQSEGA